ncbi:MAG: 4-(cytidine 5'-diphospho)-2-C-methyl-D-erythritol kinase [Chloroflexi bacterium]|nr:4-(cytidine 5'-diphospho)-2-C-methyl-D-erythritol kinase [Chloroflexota bacterium]
MEVIARGKINLTLEIIGSRSDSYHNLQSIIQTISLADEISLYLNSGISVSGEGYGFEAGKSLVKKAAMLLKEKSGYSGGVRIYVKKNIPFQSGMGADSSCAAAVLKCLNVLWGIHFSLEDLVLLASELGSDVPFFIFGGTAFMQGRGEQITPLQSLPQTYFCALFPQLKLPMQKTSLAYAAIAKKGFDSGLRTISFSQKLQTGIPIVLNDYYNCFDNIGSVLYAGYEFFREQMYQAGADHIMMSGSGPALITPCQNEDQALKICFNLLAVGHQATVFYTI